MKRILKYPLEIKDRQFIRMPDDYKLLSAKEQHGEIILWALVDNENPISGAQIHIIGTGNPIDEPNQLFEYWEYIDTVVMSNSLVWHVWDNKAPF